MVFRELLSTQYPPKISQKQPISILVFLLDRILMTYAVPILSRNIYRYLNYDGRPYKTDSINLCMCILPHDGEHGTEVPKVECYATLLC